MNTSEMSLCGVIGLALEMVVAWSNHFLLSLFCFNVYFLWLYSLYSSSNMRCGSWNVLGYNGTNLWNEKYEIQFSHGLILVFFFFKIMLFNSIYFKKVLMELSLKNKKIIKILITFYNKKNYKKFLKIVHKITCLGYMLSFPLLILFSRT